ncbi:hypothetical protein GGR52DRAFT_588010 [Hypoxylon sp. FL1284]|nr:hypothetical protein GGR52DRAFT_588010 [Hypoxylon sp. FL1284]
MTPLIEVTLSWLFKNAKGRDAKSFYTGPGFADVQYNQEIIVTAPEIGPTNSKLGVEYTHDGEGKFPALRWEAPAHIAGEVKEWLLVSEDPDAPLSTPICHGIYTGIPPTKTSVDAKDFEVEDSSKALLKGGFHYGRSRNGSVYIAPRPLLNHGPHRYFFEVIALNEPLDPSLLSASATREQIGEAIVEKVLGWGIKLDELVQELQSIKQSVNGQTTSLPSQGTGYEPLAFKEPNPQRPGIPSPISASSAAEVRPPIVPPVVTTPRPAPVAPSSAQVTQPVTHSPAGIPLAQSPGSEPTLPRALGSQPFSADDIDYYFQKYFECFHPYMPIVHVRDPNRCYETGPLLFWVIVYVASRRYARSPKVFPFLVETLKKDVFAAIAVMPLSMPSINALILLCTWIFPDVRFVNDPCALFSGVCMNTALQLGIHTGRGAHPEFSHGIFQNSFSDEETSFTWAGYNIVAQRVASCMGIPPLGGLFNQTVQNVIDGRVPFRVPPAFRVLLECQKFCNRLTRTMVACLDESRGVSPHVVQLLEDEWAAVRGLICSERADEIDRFNALLVQLEIQMYYLMPLPGYDAEALKRDALRAYSTAQAAIRSCLALDAAVDFLRHLPHFHFRALLAAGCVVFRLLRSSYRSALDAAAAERSAADVVAACRRATLADGDLPMRLGAMLQSWLDRLPGVPYAPGDDLPPVSAFCHRLSASVSFDCMTTFKKDHVSSKQRGAGQQQQSSSSYANAGLPPVGAAAPPNANAATAVAENPADPLQSIDWTFMDDFDWTFEPVMPALGAPTLFLGSGGNGGSRGQS